MVNGEQVSVDSRYLCYPYSAALPVEYLLAAPPSPLPGDAVRGLPATSLLAKSRRGKRTQSLVSLSIPSLVGHPPQSSSPWPDP